MLKVAILDKQAVAESFAVALAAEMGIDQTRAVKTVTELRVVLDAFMPDVLLVDIDLGNAQERLRLCDLRQVRTRHIPIVFMSRDNYPSLRDAVHRRGGAGYMVKSTRLSAIAQALQDVRSGGMAFDGAPESGRRNKSHLPTEREIELLRALSLGLTNGAAGRELEISPRTVESHLRRLFTRYGVTSRSQLLLLAIREGWVTAGEEPQA